MVVVVVVVGGRKWEVECRRKEAPQARGDLHFSFQLGGEIGMRWLSPALVSRGCTPVGSSSPATRTLAPRATSSAWSCLRCDDRGRASTSRMCGVGAHAPAWPQHSRCGSGSNSSTSASHSCPHAGLAGSPQVVGAKGAASRGAPHVMTPRFFATSAVHDRAHGFTGGAALTPIQAHSIATPIQRPSSTLCCSCATKIQNPRANCLWGRRPICNSCVTIQTPDGVICGRCWLRDTGDAVKQDGSIDESQTA